jgi:hypothetical protein
MLTYADVLAEEGDGAIFVSQNLDLACTRRIWCDTATAAVCGSGSSAGGGVAIARGISGADDVVCSRMLTYAHVCSRMLTYVAGGGVVIARGISGADDVVCSRMLTYAHVC